MSEQGEYTARSAFYVAIILASTFGLIFLFTSLLTGVRFFEVLRLFFNSSIGSMDSILKTLARATPILITTLGLLISFRSGVWNIGGEGQIILGAIITTGICLFLKVPHTLAIVLSIVGSFILGGLYGAFAGFLRARWDVNEVVVTMMQNFIALALLLYLINGPWNWGVGLYPRTAMIPPETRLPFIKYPLNIMFILALILVIFTHLLLNKTVLGYEIRAMGSNKMAAFVHGIDTYRLTIVSMLMSGGLCGLTGCGLVLGYFFRAQAAISGNYGFYSITVAFIANNRALLAPLSSLLIALIYEGTLGLTALGIPHSLSEAIVGIIFIVVLLPKELGWLRRN